MKHQGQLNFLKLMAKLQNAGLYQNNQLVKSEANNFGELPSVVERVNSITEQLKTNSKNKNNMFCFITYDITSSRVRRNVAKYLIRNGFIRVQYSVFFASVERKTFLEIHKTLKKINEMYDNHDSIFFIPFGEDILNKTRVVGKSIDFELISEQKNTMFF